MNTLLLLGNFGVLIGLLFAAILVWRKLQTATAGNDIQNVTRRFDEQQRSLEAIQSTMRAESAIDRSEAANAFRGLREEVGGHVTSLSSANDQRFDLLRRGIDERVMRFQEDVANRLDAIRTSVTSACNALSETLCNQLTELRGTLAAMAIETHKTQKEQTDSLVASFQALSMRLQQTQSAFAEAVEAKFTSFQDVACSKMQECSASSIFSDRRRLFFPF